MSVAEQGRQPEAASAGRHNQSIGGAPHHHMSHMHTRLPPATITTFQIPSDYLLTGSHLVHRFHLVSFNKMVKTCAGHKDCARRLMWIVARSSPTVGLRTHRLLLKVPSSTIVDSSHYKICPQE